MQKRKVLAAIFGIPVWFWEVIQLNLERRRERKMKALISSVSDLQAQREFKRRA